MEYMGEFNLLDWKAREEYFVQIPTGLKEKGLQAETILDIVQEVITAKELKLLGEMESLSASFPLKKRTAREVLTNVLDETLSQGIDFVVDFLIEEVTGVDMSTKPKDLLFTEVVSFLLDEEERHYIAAVGKYERDQLFFESLLPTSEIIRPYFVTEYEADLFVAVVALKTFKATQTFSITALEKEFLTFLLTSESAAKEFTFLYQGTSFPLKKVSNKGLSFNLFTMTLDL